MVVQKHKKKLIALVAVVLCALVIAGLCWNHYRQRNFLEATGIDYFSRESYVEPWLLTAYRGVPGRSFLDPIDIPVTTLRDILSPISVRRGQAAPGIYTEYIAFRLTDVNGQDIELVVCKDGVIWYGAVGAQKAWIEDANTVYQALTDYFEEHADAFYQ